MTGKRLTSWEKGAIDAYRTSGKSQSEISRLLGRAQSTISRYFRTVPAGETRIENYSPGRPRLINGHGTRLMARAFLRSPRKSCKKLKGENPDIFGDISVRTIQDHVSRRMGFRSRSARKKPLLSETHKRRRLAFAKKYAPWSKEQWRGVMWSDESAFKVINDSSRKVRRPLWRKGNAHGDPYADKYLVPTVKHPASIMVWGTFTGNGGRGSLTFVKPGTHITAKIYLDILKDKLIDVMEIHAASHFVQDGAPVHTAKIVKKWLNDNKIDCFEWPAQSPDLNPIENMWYFMKSRLQNYPTRSIPQLKKALTDLWCRGIEMDSFIKFAESMPKRLQQVIARKGGATSY